MLTSRSRQSPSRYCSRSRSYRTCRFSQNLSDVPKYRDNRRAVSAVIARVPRTISLIRRGGTLVSFLKKHTTCTACRPPPNPQPEFTRRDIRVGRSYEMERHALEAHSSPGTRHDGSSNISLHALGIWLASAPHADPNWFAIKGLASSTSSHLPGHGRLIGPDGQPAGDVRVYSRAVLGPSPYSASRMWPATWTEVARRGHFEIHGLDSETEVPVHFLQPNRKLGATVRLSGKMATQGPLTVRLELCGQAMARLVGPDGKAVTGQPRRVSVTMVSPRVRPTALRRCGPGRTPPMRIC